MGTRLLDRSIRPLALTPAGEVVVREARELVDRYDGLARRAQEAAKGRFDRLAGEIRVDAIYSAGIGLLNQLRDRFQEQEPGVRIVLEYKRPEQVAEAVGRGDCDLGIISYPRRWPGLSVRALREEPMCVVCAGDNPLAARARVVAAELGQLPMIGFEPGLPVSRAIARYLKANGADGDFSQVVDNIDTMKSMVAVTEQVAILPQRTVLREVASGALACLELDPPLGRPVGIVSARSRQLSPAARALIDFLLAHAGPVSEQDLARSHDSLSDKAEQLAAAAS